ncbi:hypothetical protein EJ110_NYTH00502 [Nymphaea thermarum]|nr:hypothetical protein EJ110_NYTH00502 [Nymphaea thermarum]
MYVVFDFSLADAVIEGSDGSIYFTDASTRFRCLEYWLTGKQMTELGLGGYKVFVHKSKLVKRVIAKSPSLFRWIFNTRVKAMVINVDVHGKIINYLDDSKGKVMSFATSAMEFEDHLYLGNLNTNFTGKLRLQKAKK